VGYWEMGFLHLLILGPEVGRICNIILEVSLLFSGFFDFLMADRAELYSLVLHSLSWTGFSFVFSLVFPSWLYSFSFVLDCARFLILRIITGIFMLELCTLLILNIETILLTPEFI